MLDSERKGRGGAGAQGKKPKAKEIADEMRIPSKICGMLIGSGGHKIKEIQASTGAEIFVEWDKSAHVEAGVSDVKLKGTESAVAQAKEEIRRVMAV